MKLTPEQIKTADYSSIFRAKISFRISFRQYSIPYTFVLENIVIYALCFTVIQFTLGRVIQTIGSVIMFGSIAISMILPYLCLRLIHQLQTDGKPIYYYLWDSALYYFNVLLPKKHIYKGGYRQEQAEFIVFKKR